MSATLHPHRSRGPVVAIEDITLSAWAPHPIEESALVEHGFRVHWVRESSSTVRLMHGGHAIDSPFGTYIDGAAFDSFESSIDDFRRFSQRHQVGPQSTLRVEVVTTIADSPWLQIDDPIIARLCPGDALQWALKEINRDRLLGLRVYAGIPDAWGVKTPSDFAGEPGFRSHVVRRLQPRAVAERIVWHSGMPGEPDIPALRAALIAEFGASTQGAV